MITITLCSQNFQKIFKQGGGGVGAPALDPPLHIHVGVAIKWMSKCDVKQHRYVCRSIMTPFCWTGARNERFLVVFFFLNFFTPKIQMNLLSVLSQLLRYFSGLKFHGLQWLATAFNSSLFTRAALPPWRECSNNVIRKITYLNNSKYFIIIK